MQPKRETGQSNAPTAPGALTRWRVELRSCPALRALALLSGACILAADTYLVTHRAVEYAWRVGCWLIFALLALPLIARATRDSVESPPAARHPKAELMALILYGVFIQAGGVAAKTGHFRLYAALLDAVGNHYVSSIRSLPNPEMHAGLYDSVQQWLKLGFLPLLFLVSSGNGLQSVGFRRPRGKAYLWLPVAVVGLPLMLIFVVGSVAASGLFPDITAWARAKLCTWAIRSARFLVGPGFGEELFFRAGVQTRIEVLLRNRPMAVLLSSWLFVLAHLGNMPDYSFSYWLMASGTRMTQGIVLGYLFSRTASILPGTLLHALWDMIGG